MTIPKIPVSILTNCTRQERLNLYAAKNTFVKHRRLIVFILGTVIVFWLLYALRSALLPFLAGFVLAYLFLPFILWVEQKLPHRGKWRQTKRISLIVIIYIIVLGLVALLSYYVFTAVIDAFLILLNNETHFSTIYPKNYFLNQDFKAYNLK